MQAYVTSTGNLAGCALAAAGVLLSLIVGLGAVFWPLLAVVLYGIGWVGATRLSRAHVTVIDVAASGPDIVAIRSVIEQVETRSVDLPDELALQNLDMTGIPTRPPGGVPASRCP